MPRGEQQSLLPQTSSQQHPQSTHSSSDMPEGSLQLPPPPRRHHPLAQVLAIVLYVASWVANAEALQGIANGTFTPFPYNKPAFLTWLDYNLMIVGFVLVAPWIRRQYGVGLGPFLDTIWRGSWSRTAMALACLGLSFLLTACHIFYVVGLQKISVASLNATYQLQAACTLSLTAWILGGRFTWPQQLGIFISIVGITCIVLPPLLLDKDGKDDDEQATAHKTWQTIVGMLATTASAALWGLYQVSWKALHDSKLRGKRISPTDELIDTLVTLAVIGVANLTVGWMILPILDWVGFEQFQLPPVSFAGVLTINAVIEYAFNAFIAIAIHMTSPIATSLTAPLTIPLSWVADRILYGIAIGSATAGGWGWMGALLIIVGVYYMEGQSTATDKSYDSGSSSSSMAIGLLSPSSNLESIGQVLHTRAVPGLMTVLDVALLQSVELELSGTLSTSHQAVAALLDIKKQTKVVINLVRKEELPDRQSSKMLVESFARACLDAACDILRVFSTDPLAETANLSDPYEKMHGTAGHKHQIADSLHMSTDHDNASEFPASPLTETAMDDISSGKPSGVALTSLSAHSASSVSSKQQSSATESMDEWWKALNDSKYDTGRRIPLPQRPRDLWETPRLLCVDFCWAEEVLQEAQRILKHLVKHPFVSEVNHHQAQANAHLQTRDVESPTLSSFSATTQDEIMVLLQLIQVDLPVRLLQFRAAMENESPVLKRLYTLKRQFRAPFRAFLEAHQSVLKAPPLSTLESYGTGKKESRKDQAKEKLQALLETPGLVDSLTLEQTSQHLEIEISKALYPFCELARYLDHKRASVRHSDAHKVVDMQILLHRLRGLLTRKTSGHDSSSGIRPLLMDMQKIPREDELHSGHVSLVASAAEWAEQVEGVIQQLGFLNHLCGTRGSFRSDKKAEVEPPAVITQRCTDLDVELFRCHLLDWYTIVEQQNQIDLDWAALADEIRLAELEVSLAAVSTKQSLELLGQRLRLLEKDRDKRFQVLTELLDDLCRRELNLLIRLEPPAAREVLTLRSTSAKGVFGLPLEMAGETLPIG